MLSPSMITNSNGKFWRAATIRCATSYCAASPVPMSPMAAKRTEPDLSGNLNSSARATRKKMLAKLNRSTRIFLIDYPESNGWRKYFVNAVDDQVRFNVQKDQIATHDPVSHFVRQFGKPQQKRRGHGSERHAVRIRFVDAHMNSLQRFTLLNCLTGQPALRASEFVAYGPTKCCL